MAQTTEKEQAVIAPFAVQADHPRNSDLLLQAIEGGIRLRSTVRADRRVFSRVLQEEVIPPDQSTFLSKFPVIPGMVLAVNPAKLTWLVTDPLSEDPDLCAKIKSAMKRVSQFNTDARLEGEPDRQGRADAHRIKTLCREVRWLLDAGHVVEKKGAVPTLEEIAAMPGHFLLNPGSQVPNTQPRFEKDWDVWLEKLASYGG